MREVVLDASVVIKWFKSHDERHVGKARSLRAEFEAGLLTVIAPTLLPLELLNAAGRRWGWRSERLTALALALETLGLEFREPDLREVASWVARGLTAYDAAYAALASSSGRPLVTDDDHLAAVASAVAQPLMGA